MKKRESYKKHLNRGVMAVSFAVIFIVFSIMGGRIQAFADDAVATQTDAAKSNSSGPVTTGLIMSAVYPSLVSNVNCGVKLTFAPWLWAVLYDGILVLYFIINRALVGRLNKIVPAEVLKNRE